MFSAKSIKMVYFTKGCLERSLMYARHSLYNECEAQSRNGGLVHLTVASVYLELGGFRRCLEVSLMCLLSEKTLTLFMNQSGASRSS